MFWLNDHILLDGCTVSYNVAARSVGAIRFMAWAVSIIDSSIVGNLAIHDYGGIYIDDAHDVTIRNTDMSNNSAMGDVDARYADIDAVGGGSLGLYNCDNVEIENCSLDNNYAYLDGGAICVIYSNDVVIRNTTLRGNVASTGAAVNVFKSERVSFDNLLIERNIANGNGGGILLDRSRDILVSNCSFLRNTATEGSGSAFHIYDSTAHFTGNLFDANEAHSGYA